VEKSFWLPLEKNHYCPLLEKILPTTTAISLPARMIAMFVRGQMLEVWRGAKEMKFSDIKAFRRSY